MENRPRGVGYSGGLAVVKSPRLWVLGGAREKGEFDAAAHGVDAFGADTDAITKFPDKRLWLFATAAAAAIVVAGHGDYGVIALAIKTASAGNFVKGIDGDEAFDEDIEEFDEAAVFLHGDDEGIVFVAQVLLHELRGLPGNELALGGGGAALGFGSFGGDFFQMLLRIKSGFDADGRLDVRGGLRLRIGECPFEDAMNDEIGIAANGRGEMRVLIEAKSEVPERFRRVAGLFEGAQH